MPKMPSREPPDGHEEREAVVADLFAGVISAKTAAERLASISLQGKPESGLNVTWASILYIAQDSSDHLMELVSLLLNMANLPAPKDDNGKPLVIYGLRVWSKLCRELRHLKEMQANVYMISADLPMLGWDFNDEWNSTASDLLKNGCYLGMKANKIFQG